MVNAILRLGFRAVKALTLPALILGVSYWWMTRDAGAWLLIDNATRADAEVVVDGVSLGTVRARSFRFARSSPGAHRLAARFADGAREELSAALPEPDSPIARVTGVYNLAGAGRYVALQVHYGSTTEPSTLERVGWDQRFFVAPGHVDADFDVNPPPSLPSRSGSRHLSRLCHATVTGQSMCLR